MYSINLKIDGTSDSYKARLVVQRYKQEYGMDYEETFRHVAKMITIHTLLTMDSMKGWTLHQMDVKMHFSTAI